MKSLIGALALALTLLGSGSARADPRLDEKVYDPYILNGIAEFEARNAQELGGPLGGQTTTVLEAEYGLNDRVSLALVGAIQRPAGETTRLAGIGLESVAYLGRLPAVGVDAGLYVEYKVGFGGEGDVAEAKVLLAKTAGRFQGLLNLIVEEPVGAPPGEGFASYGYAASATWQTVGNLRLGAEAFGDFGDDHAFLGRQGAYVGPQVKWEGRLGASPVELGLDAGWLAAVGADRGEANSQVRIGIELERRF
ncbi:MAG: hypothetical protein ACR2FH_10275 [Caulobacteraceae bacterium]